MDQWKASKESVKAYDLYMRHQRDGGRLQTESILRSRIDLGCALEIGPGPGYEGLEWLMKTEDTTLIGLDISEDIVALARKNAREYGLEKRAEYRVGDAGKIPYAKGRFDAVFSINSLHEWAQPKKVFDEIERVLRPGGKYLICDLRRDMNPLIKCFSILCQSRTQKEIRNGFISSVDASYTLQETMNLLAETKLEGWKAEQSSQNIIISGRKEYDAFNAAYAAPARIMPLLLGT